MNTSQKKKKRMLSTTKKKILKYNCYDFGQKNSKYIECRGHDTDSWFQVRRTCNHVEHRRCDTFVHQVLRTFNMLTKSKISEARCSDVEDIVTMLRNEVAIHYLQYCSFRVSDASHLQHAYEIKDFGSTIPSSKNL